MLARRKMGDTAIDAVNHDSLKTSESIVTETKTETTIGGTVTATKTTEIKTETPEGIVVEKKTVVKTETITNGDVEKEDQANKEVEPEVESRPQKEEEPSPADSVGGGDGTHDEAEDKEEPVKLENGDVAGQ